MAAIWLPFVDAWEAGLWIFWVLDSEIVAVPRPAILSQGDRLHCETGPAVAWPNGSKFFFWHGVQVNERVVLQPETITVDELRAEANAEVRRVLVERYGAARYLQDAGAKLISKDKFGKLWRMDVANDEPIVMVEVINSTPEPDNSVKVYWLRVPPTTKTCRAGVAWTFGLKPGEYQPDIMS